MYQYIRNKIRNVVLDILSAFSIPKPGIHILNGHFLSIKDNKTNEIFYNQLKALQNNGVEFINFDEAVKRIDSNEIHKNKCFVAFSFDDGFEECYSKIRPVLMKFGIKACFFINPNFINGDIQYQENFKNNVVFTQKQPMNWNQILELQNDGHIIGAHTMDHLDMNIDDKKILEYQIGESKKYLENKLSTKCEYFAFPFGQLKHINAVSIEIAQNHFKYIFSQSNYKFYFSFKRKVINRRHFECDWPYKHVIYFLKRKVY